MKERRQVEKPLITDKAGALLYRQTRGRQCKHTQAAHGMLSRRYPQNLLLTPFSHPPPPPIPSLSLLFFPFSSYSYPFLNFFTLHLLCNYPLVLLFQSSSPLSVLPFSPSPSSPSLPPSPCVPPSTPFPSWCA